MITINFVGGVADFDAIAKAGITMICDKNMNLQISEEDYKRLENEFEAAYMDSYIVKDDVNKNIGQRIQVLRKEAGMTQQQLADKCGILRPNIARIENGRYGMTVDVLARIAQALGCELAIIEKPST